MSGIIYLAGPIEYVPDGGVTWRRQAALLARESTRLIDPTHYDGASSGLTSEEIVTRDRYLLRKSEGVIFDARSTSAGWGTAMELLDAYQLGKPTVGWGAPENKSAFLSFHCTKFFDDLGEAIVYMENLLGSEGNVPETDLAWAAGLFEGEGTIAISRRAGSNGVQYVKVAVAMTDMDILVRYSKIMGLGPPTVHTRHTERSHYKPIWTVATSNRSEVIRVLGLLLPYLGERRTGKAQEALEYFRTYAPYARVGARPALTGPASPAILTPLPALEEPLQ